MAWTTPMTAVANEVFTAAQYNTYVRDNLLETAPGICEFPSQYFYKLGNQLYANTVGSQFTGAAASNITSTTYADAPDGQDTPLVREIHSGGFLLWVGGQVANTSATGTTYMSVEITRESNGEVVYAASDDIAFFGTGTGVVASTAGPHPSPGVYDDIYVFTMKYRVSSGTGIIASRTLHVFPF